MALLITGGLGFVGSHLVEALQDDHEIVILDDFSSGKKENLCRFKNLTIHKNCITNFDFVENLFRQHRFSAVVHLAAMASVNQCLERPYESSETNLWASLKLLHLAAKYQVGKFIFASSAAIYGDLPDLPKRESVSIPYPISTYGQDKRTMEKYMSVYGQKGSLKTVAFRFFNIYGPRQDPQSPYSGVISIFLRNLQESPNPICTVFGDGKQTRDFIYIQDVIQGLVMGLEKPEMDNKIFNLGTGREVSVLQLIKELETVSGKKVRIKFAPARPDDILRSYCSNDLISSYGFTPRYSLQEGLKHLYGATKRDHEKNPY